MEVVVNKYYKTLELDKIFNLIKKHTILDKSDEQLDKNELLNNIEEIQYALDEVDEGTILIQRMGRFPLYFNSDIKFLLDKVKKQGVLTADELLQIGNLLDSIKENYIYLDKLDNAEIEVEFFNQKILSMIYNKNLNLDIKKIINSYGEINDDASATLKSLRRKQIELESSIQKQLQIIINKNANKLTQNIVSIRNNRYVIPVKVDFKNTFKGIIHDQSASGETVFIEPAIINNINNNLNQAKEQEKREIYRILSEISYKINDNYDDLLYAYETFVYLDIVFAKAQYALNINANKPNINDVGIVDLLNCRHPLLNVEEVVSNNINIGSYKGIIITGPNTGGKTVLLKTIGLLSLMVKAGILIPADSNSNINIFEDVYADIGDEQSIDQNLSTFSSHLKNIVNIIDLVNDKSLVLLDELGSGTDPSEGSSLAISIFDYLINKDCLVIATSHYSELKIHAYNSENILNASVEFDEKTLNPTYKLLMGVPGMSNALKIAKNLGLKEEIIDKANAYAYKKSDNLNIALDKLIKQEHQLEAKIKAFHKQKEILDEKIFSLDQEKKRIKQEEKNIIKAANKKADELIKNARKEIDELLKELKEMKNTATSLPKIADATYRAKKLYGNRIEEEIVTKEHKLNIGDQVFVKPYESYGKIIKKLKNDFFEIQIGSITTKVKNKYLIPTKKEVPKKHTHRSISIKKQVSSRLDLHGERYADAKEKLDKFLDDAIYGNLNEVIIIHGYGTGVIRKLVHDTLNNHPYIEDFRLGNETEGGHGVTVAKLK